MLGAEIGAAVRQAGRIQVLDLGGRSDRLDDAVRFRRGSAAWSAHRVAPVKASRPQDGSVQGEKAYMGES
jgi:hypothetical protein